MRYRKIEFIVYFLIDLFEYFLNNSKNMNRVLINITIYSCYRIRIKSNKIKSSKIQNILFIYEMLIKNKYYQLKYTYKCIFYKNKIIILIYLIVLMH